ncbi:hypothetical protein LCGC14_0964270 [marine sediment metagenome]|uniref:Uncharacterized protein n=1 Tax=marine sediment metagenome TaxID=412755 RepID=A0A0F9NI18_9ZZZZ
MEISETLDWTKLAKDVVPDADKIPYESNKHLFTKIAFDVFQLNNVPVESYWILEDGEDGNQYLVAQYGEELTQESLESKSHWLALADRDKKNVTLAYKNEPIQRFASSEYGFSEKDIHVFQRTLIEKLSYDKTFVDKLLRSQPEEKRKMLLEQFPELV